MPLRLPAMSAAALALSAACATTPAQPTLVARALLGANAQGEYAFAEVASGPGEPASGFKAVVGANGRERERSPLSASTAAQAASRAAASGSAPGPAVEQALAGEAPAGFALSGMRRIPLAAEGTRISLEPATGAPVEVAVRRGSEGLRVALRLQGEAREAPLLQAAFRGRCWQSELWVLP